MALDITGRLFEIFPTQQITPTFSKREFVLEISEQAANGMTYTNYASFQLVNATCSSIDGYQKGDMVTVNFNLRGNKWEKDGQVRYITNLNAWRVQAAGANQAMPQQSYQQPQGQGNFGGNTQGFAAQPNNAPSFDNSGDGGDDLPF